MLVGSVSALFTKDAISGWYQTLHKPWFNPPNAIFGPVWSVLYLLIGVASWLIFKTDHVHKKQALIWFYIQLVLNFFWSIIFFYFQNPSLAFIEVLIMWLCINGCIIQFSKISKPAAYLMLPYVMWVSFASILNYYVMILN